MNDRTKELLRIRPEIKTTQVHDAMSQGERFQNETLRPILKLQNNLFVEMFRNYIKKYKNAFFELSLEKRFVYLENAIQKDIKFRNSLKGTVIGQFTVEEYGIYAQNSSALNKRMMHMVLERLKSQIQLFERPVLSY